MIDKEDASEFYSVSILSASVLKKLSLKKISDEHALKELTSILARHSGLNPSGDRRRKFNAENIPAELVLMVKMLITMAASDIELISLGSRLINSPINHSIRINNSTANIKVDCGNGTSIL